MKVSVIIPVYRDWERLERCLAALAAQSVPPDEVIVVANDGEASAHRQLGAAILLIEEGKPGSYNARNKGAGVARGDVLAFTDSDCIPNERWLEAARDALLADPGRRLTGPVRIFREAGGGRHAWLHDRHFAFPERKDAERGICPTANLIVAKTVFERVGPFAGGLLSGGDVEWSKRATRAGVPLVFDPALWVAHPARRTVGQLFGRRRRIAGAHPFNPDVQALSYIRHALRPPLRDHAQLRAAPDVTRTDRFLLFLLLWGLNLAGLAEYLLVALRLKKPKRS